MSELILQINHLSKSFGSHEVLRDIDFTVEKGDVTSIIGASGSGKSTLLRCINLLETPTSGEILYHGENVVGQGVNATAQSGTHRDVFVEKNVERGQVELLFQREVDLHHEVVGRRARNRCTAEAKLVGGIAVLELVDFKVVAQENGVENRFEVVVAIGPAGYDVQSDIDFAGREDKHVQRFKKRGRYLGLWLSPQCPC